MKCASNCYEVILSASYPTDYHDCVECYACEERVCLLCFLIDYYDCDNVLTTGAHYLPVVVRE